MRKTGEILCALQANNTLRLARTWRRLSSGTRKIVFLVYTLITSFGYAQVCCAEESSSAQESQYIQTHNQWWSPGAKRQFPASYDYANDNGTSRILLDGDPMETQDHPFFTAIGPNGRACVTCHQPADGMSLSSSTIRERWDQSDGRDPLFAAYDGSNCPSLPQQKAESHSLLLEHGLFRIELPWPPKPRDGREVTPDFSLDVVRDPWGCNANGKYGIEGENRSISVYRRPRPVANLKYLTAVGFAYDPKQGMPLPLDSQSGKPLSGNIMADNRAVTLQAQMQDAAVTHLEFIDGLSDQQLKQIEHFILKIYAAQAISAKGGRLADGAHGGPELLRDSQPGQLGSIGRAVWSEFESWENMTAKTKAKLSTEQIAYRESVARGARVFREKMFLITDSAGINSPIGFGNPVLNSCVFCHNMSQMGNDVAPGQVDLGTTNKPFADPAPHLPLFKVTCQNEPHPHYGQVIYTQDPGFGLITGKCADVGKVTLQSMRSLSARPPYFSNGSAADLKAVVDFYDRRYNIGYTELEKQDLVNLMGAL